MTVAAARPRPKLPPLLMAAVVAAPLLASPPVARASDDCLLDYANCVDGASDLQGFWSRSGAGIRCYLDLLSCLQRRLA
jgi:hypothetical protein